MHLAHSQLRVTAECKMVLTCLSVGNTSLSIPFFFPSYRPSHQQPSLSFPLSVYSLLFFSRQQVIDPQSHLSILESGYSKLDLRRALEDRLEWYTLVCADLPTVGYLFNTPHPHPNNN